MKLQKTMRNGAPLFLVGHTDYSRGFSTLWGAVAYIMLHTVPCTGCGGKRDIEALICSKCTVA